MKILRITLPRSRFPWLCVLASSLLFSTVHAQVSPASSSTSAPKKADEAEVVQLNPFTVSETQRSPWNSQQTFSGSRVAENIMDVPINIAIINNDFLQAIGATNITEVLNFAGSGVNQRVSYRDDLSIRGFREAANRDGVTFTGYAKTEFYDIDRIEVIKGPTALVYGNFSSIGGTVNYVTKRPTATSQGDAHFSVGTDGFYSADYTQRGPLTQDARLRYRVTVGGQLYDGYKESEYENNKLFSGSMDWKVNDQLELRFDYGHADSVRRDMNRSLVDPVTRKLAKLPSDFSISANWAQVPVDYDRFRLEAIYQPTKNLTARVLGNSFENNYSYRFPQPTPGLKAAESPNYMTIGQRFLAFDLRDKKQDVQADVTWNLARSGFKNRLTAGWAHVYNNGYQNLMVAPLADIIIAAPFDRRPAKPDPATWSYLIKDAYTRSSGWTTYVQDALTLLDDRLILTAGLRWVPKGATSKGVSTEVPRYGAIYKINEGISLYAGYAESFNPLSGIDILGRPYEDIYGKGKEGGIKFNTFEGRLFGSVTYFDILNDPVVTQVQIVHPQTGQLIFGNIQTAKQTNKGYELDAGTLLTVGPGQLLGYATYYDATPRDASGLRPARVVSRKATLFAKYEFKEGSVTGFSIGAGVSDYGDSIGTGIPIQPAYTLYSGFLGYAFKRWQWQLNLDNLTNVEDAILGSEANFSVHTARPFSAKLTATYRW